MEIIPAVDIKNGKCVRLYQGDYRQETVFSDDPVDAALKWYSMGAPRIHIVDLDGAVAGELRNLRIITEIAHSVLVPTQVGGGIRSAQSVTELLKAGVERVVLGTAAVENPELVQEMCRRHGNAIVVSIDTREGLVSTRGWNRETALKGTDLAHEMARLGVKRFIYTDITRDGTLTEPNFTAISEFMESVKLPVIAAGGISSPAHLKVLKQLGVEGAIIGKALYTGDINLKQALATIDS
ncbi:MAG: 1-(5-phosphoribosyl)-5-[(5-phosphoribosylamino)methylideneamino]imidazole-4-carboxamide isomerase [Chloroflexi bacterium]|nr:1-(5-phosphoribosyl)-5-[(5-phosphoribosylamino)methylideneamino]imidazole-4-carboxamide isomerase [Chloroflexota bacterium]